MQFLLVPNGTYGDVHPYLGIANVLRARGHDVTFACNPFFSDLLNDAGFDLIPLRTIEELEEYWHHADMWSRHNYWKLALDYCALRPMRDMYRVVAEHYVPGKTVVAGPAWSFGARIAQEKLGVPLATMHLEPYWIRGLHRTSVMPPPMVTRDWVPKISKRFQFWIADVFFTDRFLSRPTNAFRAELGLPPARRFLRTWWHSPQRVIGLFPEWFFPPQPDWPPQVRLTGFPLWDRSSIGEVSEEVETFLDEGPPPVAFTPGTGNHQAGRFFAAAAEGCRLAGRRGLFLTDHPRQLPDKLPGGVRHFSYVPFSYLLKRTAALVHHAGTGTAALCMRAGLPQVVMPMAYDQPDFADCLVRLGVAELIKPRAFTGRAVAKALDRMLNAPQVAERCREVAAKFQAADPIEQMCDLLVELVGKDGEARVSST